MRPSKPGLRGASMRSSIWSMTWTAAVRPKARHQRAGHRVVVVDRAGGRRVLEHRVGRVRQRQRQRLVVVVVRIVEHGHVDARRAASGPDRERAAGRGVVRARLGRAVRRLVVDGHVGSARAAQRHREGEDRAGRFLYPRIRDRDSGRSLDALAGRVAELPAVVRADAAAVVAVARFPAA